MIQTIPSSLHILANFQQGQYDRILCPQCENTFMTNVYRLDADHVLLEKHSLSLEYLCDAKQAYPLQHTPVVQRIAVLDEDNHPLPAESIVLFSHDEPTYRVLYAMERLEHLGAEDTSFFTEHVHAIDWLAESQRQQLWVQVNTHYGQSLADDLCNLCRYYRQHSDYIGWDLHGDNLMRRPKTGEIVVMDPFITKMV